MEMRWIFFLKSFLHDLLEFCSLSFYGLKRIKFLRGVQMVYDAIVVGGSFAGLSAALHIARANRRVLVIDSGMPRNRFSKDSHGFFSSDGKSGVELLEAARQQVNAYPTTRFLTGEVQKISGSLGEFRVSCERGEVFEAKRIVLATGVKDVLPDIPGLKERWGKSVLLCPYCHGYEIGGGNIGVLGVSPLSIAQALLLADWGTITLFNNGIVIDADAKRKLDQRHVSVEESPVAALLGPDLELVSVLLANGQLNHIRALFISSPIQVGSNLASQLGCVFDEMPIGPVIRTDIWKHTSVPGIYAAGDNARFPHNISGAASDGALAGIGLHQSLVFERNS